MSTREEVFVDHTIPGNCVVRYLFNNKLRGWFLFKTVQYAIYIKICTQEKEWSNGAIDEVFELHFQESFIKMAKGCEKIRIANTPRPKPGLIGGGCN
jgi:hypothetical protein